MNIIMRALGDIDEKYLDEVMSYKKKSNILKLAMPIAACFVVLSCFALYSFSPTTQNDGDTDDAPALDTTTTESAVDGSAGSTQDTLLFEYWGEVIEVLENNTAIIRITQTDLNLEMYDGLFFDVGEDVIVNFAADVSVIVEEIIELTNENYYILEGEFYENEGENFS